MCQSLLLFTCDGEFSVFIDTTDLARLAAGEPALSYTDPGRAWHPVGGWVCIALFSVVCFLHCTVYSLFIDGCVSGENRSLGLCVEIPRSEDACVIFTGGMD